MTDEPSSLAPSSRWQSFVDRFHEQSLRAARWLVYGRLSLLFLLFFAFSLTTRPGREFSPALVATLAFYFAATLAYIVFLPRVHDQERFVRLQISIDVAFEIILVYLTGGCLDLTFPLLHLLSVVTAALLVSARAGFVAASIGSVSLAFTTSLYYAAGATGWQLPLIDHELTDYVLLRWDFVVANLIKMAVGLHLVAALAASLSLRFESMEILYDDILKELRDGVLVIDRAGRVLFYNQEAERLFAWDRHPRVLGTPLAELLRLPEDQAILDVLTLGSEIHGEVDLGDPKNPLPIELRSSILRDRRGQLRGVIGVFSDLTLKRRVSLAAQRIERLRGLEEMAMGIAHEVRNPLASIRGAMQELARRSFSDEDDRELAAIILRESDRLDAIVDDFMQYARSKPLELRPFDLLALLNEVKRLLELREDCGQVRIRVEGQLQRPELELDRDKLMQVLLNLGVNALQALEGQGSLTLSATEGTLDRAATGDGARLYGSLPAVILELRDDGPGVPLAHRSRLFTPFFSTKPSGTGLGLPIAQKIIDAHNGDLSYEPAPEGGSIFRMVLPRSALPKLPSNNPAKVDP